MSLTFFPASTKRVCSSFTCVVLPLLSRPSSTISEPLTGLGSELLLLSAEAPCPPP